MTNLMPRRRGLWRPSRARSLNRTPCRRGCRGGAALGVFDRGVVDGHVGAFGQQAGDAAFGAGGEFVAQADVGERAADHDSVVAAAAAVGVEVGGGDAVSKRYFPAGRSS